MRRAEADAHEQLQQRLRQAWAAAARERREAETSADLLRRACDERHSLGRVDCGPWTTVFETETASAFSIAGSGTRVQAPAPEESASASRAAIGSRRACVSDRAFAARLDHFGRLRRGGLNRTSSNDAPQSCSFDLQTSHADETCSFNAPLTLGVDEAAWAAKAQRQRWGARERSGPTFCPLSNGRISDGGNCMESGTGHPGTNISRNVHIEDGRGRGTNVPMPIAEDFAKLRATAAELRGWLCRGNGPIY
jgi:hypothetical protein